MYFSCFKIRKSSYFSSQSQGGASMALAWKRHVLSIFTIYHLQDPGRENLCLLCWSVLVDVEVVLSYLKSDSFTVSCTVIHSLSVLLVVTEFLWSWLSSYCCVYSVVTDHLHSPDIYWMTSDILTITLQFGKWVRISNHIMFSRCIFKKKLYIFLFSYCFQNNWKTSQINETFFQYSLFILRHSDKNYKTLIGFSRELKSYQPQ